MCETLCKLEVCAFVKEKLLVCGREIMCLCLSRRDSVCHVYGRDRVHTRERENVYVNGNVYLPSCEIQGKSHRLMLACLLICFYKIFPNFIYCLCPHCFIKSVPRCYTSVGKALFLDVSSPITYIWFPFMFSGTCIKFHKIIFIRCLYLFQYLI